MNDNRIASKRSEPIFKQVLGDEWETLGPAVRRHYFLRPYSHDAITVEGTMDEVRHSWLTTLLRPFLRIMGALVPYSGTNVPIAVHYNAEPEGARIHWDRVFRFPQASEYRFRSFMEPGRRGEVVEFVRFGIGIRLKMTAEAGVLVFRDMGYVWRIGPVRVPLPLHWLLGRAYIEERSVDEREFAMRMTLTHPWFGETFCYRGRFSLPK